MPISPVMEPPVLDEETAELMADPEVQAALAELDAPEDREDLIDHLMAMKRYREGKDRGTPWEEVMARLGL